MVTYLSDKVRQIQIFEMNECIMKIILIFMISEKSRQRKIFDHNVDIGETDTFVKYCYSRLSKQVESRKFKSNA